MTVTADSKKRVVIPLASPGDRFDVKSSGSGEIVLRLLEPVQERPARVRMEKRGKFTVGVLDRQINERALREALDDFP